MRTAIIREAGPADVDAIAAVHRTSMRTAMPWLPELHTPEEDRNWVATILLPEQSVWVAEADGQIVGMMSCTAGWVEQLYILPAYQGQGIGDALLAKAKELHPGGLDLWAFQRNTPARGFYERRGFVAIEFTDGEHNEEREPDVRYRWTP